MKIIVLARYDRRGASSRLRMIQYLPHLRQAGLDAEVASLFDSDYLEQMYAGRRSPAMLFRSMLRRVAQLRMSADIVWLEYEALPWLPWMIESSFWPRSIPVVTEYDDAIFHRYDQNRHALVRALLGCKIDKVMRASKLVIAGNKYLADRARTAGASRVEVVPTVVDIEGYEPAKGGTADERRRIGWIGTPETWRSLASQYGRVIESVALDHGALFRVIGAEPAVRIAEPYEYLPWSEADEVTMIRGMDIGVMPLPDTPWTRGKCGYKLIQYMACGLPVVASPVGLNKEIVEHGVNGFLADSDEEWKSALTMLLKNPELRRRMGREGRRKVEREYSLQVQGPRVAQLLREVAERDHV